MLSQNFVSFRMQAASSVLNRTLYRLVLYSIIDFIHPKGRKFNPLAPNDVYVRCVLKIYSTNILTEYFKHAAHSPFFALQDAVYFIMLYFLVPVILTF